MAKKTLEGGVVLSPGVGKAFLPPTSAGTCFSLGLSGRGVKCLLYKSHSQIRHCILPWDREGWGGMG